MLRRSPPAVLPWLVLLAASNTAFLALRLRVDGDSALQWASPVGLPGGPLLGRLRRRDHPARRLLARYGLGSVTARRSGLLALLAAVALLAGCRGDHEAVSDAVTGEVIVSAASSLTEAFTDAARAFERQYPGTKVTLNFASSSALATQISEGAPADVFASADEAQIAAVGAGRLAAPPVVFARNRLVIAKPKGSTAVVTYGDLAKPGLRLVLAADGVPAGAYAMRSLDAAERGGTFGADFRARVLANVRSREANVRSALAKVELGEADGTIVYQTDTGVSPKVEAVAIPDAYNVDASYFIAPLRGGKNPAAGAAFVAFVRGDGSRFLAGRGFTIPPR